MNPPIPTPSFEVCPACSQPTAAQFFRSVGKQRLCVLCAKRADRAEVDSRAQIEDHRLHGGAGWLWRHIAYTVYATVGGLALRLIILHFLRSH